MQKFMESHEFEIQAQIRNRFSFAVRYDIQSKETEENIGEIIIYPAWSTPFLWLLGIITEIALVVGGLYFVFKGQNNSIWFGLSFLFLGLLFFFGFKFHTFLASRAPSTIKIKDDQKEVIVVGNKGWALWKPIFTVTDGSTNNMIGQSRQSFLLGDCRYTLWDHQGNIWGSIRRRPFGFTYRIIKDSKEVAHFRKQFVDARKIMTGVSSYLLDFLKEEKETEAENEKTSLIQNEKLFVFGVISYIALLSREKKLKEKEQTETKEQPKKE